MPLILNGWGFSNDMDKLRRWEAMIEWANKNGCADLVETIPVDQFYCVETPTTYTVGPMGGPMYREWDFQPRHKPDAEVLQALVETLKSRWAEITGSQISEMTQPIRFDGSKARRLIVRATASMTPPWGTWETLSPDEEKRRSFTRLRAAINAAIAPHEVDHIDFVTDKT